MPNINNIEIDKNSICYGDEVLKISNISRMCIFRFKNLKREEHEREKQRYKDSKRYYEQREHNKKKIEIRNYSIMLYLQQKEPNGRDALRKLREDIKNADVHNQKTVFNMNEYNVQVEGDIDGIVNLGNDNINVNREKDLLNLWW